MLDGEVAALVEQRKGGGHVLWRHVEVAHSGVLASEVAQADIVFLEQFDDVGGRARVEPVVADVA